MLFKYKAITKDGKEREGAVDAVSEESAVNALQKRGLIVSDLWREGDSWFSQIQNSSFFGGVSHRDMVVISRQISTLFEAQISALRVFRLLSEETENDSLRMILEKIANDIQDGKPLSEAFARHPKVFSSFYINMVRAGEESGQLNETFKYLADYLERTHDLISKAKHALIYPAFVIVVFIAVMILIFTAVIPEIAGILTESGQELPIYTKIVIAVSDFFVNYGIYLLGLVVAAIAGVIWWARTPSGSEIIDTFKLSIPLIGTLYKKLYLARIADTMTTLISSGVSMTRALEVSSIVVDNRIYKKVLEEVTRSVKDGAPVSEAFSRHEEIPTMMVQMIKVSEEGGAVGSVLSTLAVFYQKEVTAAVDTLMSLIEPIMMIALGLLVGFLLASVLIPIYDVASGTAF
ncbi:MAG: type II secretion system F family protein [Candidatus Paceibacterota bacterium]